MNAPRQLASIWASGQQHQRTQRAGRYTKASTEHPAKMPPALAAHAIAAYSRRGDLVVDPMCGIGTSVVEAMHLGRDAIGVDCEPPWVDMAVDNIDLATAQGAAGTGSVRCGDARDLPDLLPLGAVGDVALILASPPYGLYGHARVRTYTGPGRLAATSEHPFIHRPHPGQLALTGPDRFAAGLAEVLLACHEVLRPGGFLVLTGRPYRAAGLLIDLPGELAATAAVCGFDLHARHVALLASWNDGVLRPHHSFFGLHHARRLARMGFPAHLCVHEDVIVARRPR
ncbi:TRM11 family SAM-dependent methyltransferase [Glycomyces buryatensis]|uniref:Methyltransferase n=1 Tax=Glycomyces buryatensis TaxID=2570927 RepID=A0A4S8PVV6_9ACTN|nr:DNA methyltransferase [Glycomyces buryatensis]THV35723.1 site-specific DNA-methyltransferase [Glycomyces buryatensis]